MSQFGFKNVGHFFATVANDIVQRRTGGRQGHASGSEG